jgi:hypothetical protein
MKKTARRSRNNPISIRIFLSLIFTALLFSAFAQKGDSARKQERNFKNSIKLNFSANLVYRNSLLAEYERVINKHQSINVFGGYQEFPIDLELDLSDTRLNKTRKNSGYSIGVDYRFYLAKANKCLYAPRGVYLAPFVSLQHFHAERRLEHTQNGVTTSTDLKSSINLFNIGGELGYQFVIGRRFVIDAMLFGPALTHYDFNAQMSGELDGLDSNEAIQAVIDALKQRFPFFDELTSEGGVHTSGREAFWSAGFRYTISIGFRF